MERVDIRGLTRDIMLDSLYPESGMRKYLYSMKLNDDYYPLQVSFEDFLDEIGNEVVKLLGGENFYGRHRE